MIIICGAEEKGEVAICSDNLISTDYIAYLPHKKSPKIIKINESYLGFTGSHVMITILEHILKKRSKAEIDSLFCFDDEVEIHDTLIKLHPILKKEYFINTTDGENRSPTELSQLQGLMINKNGVYHFAQTRGVIRHKFFATGSGEELALGAMYAMYHSGEYSAREIVEMGVKVACEFNMVACEFNMRCGLPLNTYVIKTPNSNA